VGPTAKRNGESFAAHAVYRGGSKPDVDVVRIYELLQVADKQGGK